MFKHETTRRYASNEISSLRYHKLPSRYKRAYTPSLYALRKHLEKSLQQVVSSATTSHHLQDLHHVTLFHNRNIRCRPDYIVGFDHCNRFHYCAVPSETAAGYDPGRDRRRFDGHSHIFGSRQHSRPPRWRDLDFVRIQRTA
jgi:hypothetical protein